MGSAYDSSGSNSVVPPLGSKRRGRQAKSSLEPQSRKHRKDIKAPKDWLELRTHEITVERDGGNESDTESTSMRSQQSTSPLERAATEWTAMSAEQQQQERINLQLAIAGGGPHYKPKSWEHPSIVWRTLTKERQEEEMTRIMQEGVLELKQLKETKKIQKQADRASKKQEDKIAKNTNKTLGSTEKRAGKDTTAKKKDVPLSARSRDTTSKLESLVSKTIKYNEANSGQQNKDFVVLLHLKDHVEPNLGGGVTPAGRPAQRKLDVVAPSYDYAKFLLFLVVRRLNDSKDEDAYLESMHDPEATYTGALLKKLDDLLQKKVADKSHRVRKPSVHHKATMGAITDTLPGPLQRWG